MNTLNQTPEHPANEELAAFALGKETANAETIAEHVANCPRCETLVAETPRDTFLGILNKAKPGSSLTGLPVPKSNPPSADELPDELRQQTKYTFLKKLGGGGMGVVYLAEHNLMKRKVAVKLIPPEMLGNPSIRERFLQEVVSAAALEHPNVVRAYSTEEFGQHMVFEMEFVDGLDLGQVVKSKGPLPVVFAVNYIRQAAQGLQHGMLKSLVHRDIKPGNLMLTRAGSVKVADFGLAKFSRETDKRRDRSLTGMNAMMGTPDYMAPEQARNAKTADIRADIYSLGCTFYYLLTGQPPFAGESIADLIFKHWEDPRPDVCVHRNDVPEELSQYIQKMMSKEAGDRPQTPKEVVDWLTKFAKEPTKKETISKPKVETLVDVKKKGDEIWKFDGFTPEPAAQKTAITQRKSQPKMKWPMTGGAITCLLALVVFVPLACWLVLRTPNGTLVVEIADKDVEARIKGGKLILTGPDGKVRYTLTPSQHDNTIEVGAYKIHVEGADGLTLDTPEFTLKKGDTVTVRVTIAPIAVAKKPPKKATPITDPPPGEKWVSLFNGKDLTGLKTEPEWEGGWRAENGVLIWGRADPSRIWTERGDFTDFHLRVEARVSDGGYCQIIVRGTFQPSGQFAADGYRTVINSTGLNGNKTGGLIVGVRREVVNVSKSPVPPNQWFSLEMIAKGNRVVVKVNGQTMADYTDPDRCFARGHILLRPVNKQIEFRNIEIKELPAAK